MSFLILKDMDNQTVYVNPEEIAYLQDDEIIDKNEKEAVTTIRFRNGEIMNVYGTALEIANEAARITNSVSGWKRWQSM